MTKGLEKAIALGLKTYDHRFGRQSLKNLSGVLPSLFEVAELAICLSEFDGTVLPGGGVRSEAQARANVANGTGILNSLHRKQADGFGHAIDLVALTHGRVNWQNLTAFKAMAKAVKLASAILGVPVRQGCDWNMNGLLGEPGTKEYDWPHFEEPQPWARDAARDEMNRVRASLGLDAL